MILATRPEQDGPDEHAQHNHSGRRHGGRPAVDRDPGDPRRAAATGATSGDDCHAQPAHAATAGPAETRIDRLVDRVWVAEPSPTVAAGAMYVFLSDNVLVTSATGKPPSLGSWAEDVAGLVITEKGTTSKVDVLELTAERLRIRIHGKTPAEITFAPAIRPPAPPPAPAGTTRRQGRGSRTGGSGRPDRHGVTDAVPMPCGSPSRTTRPTSRGPTARRRRCRKPRSPETSCVAAHVQRRTTAGRRRHERVLHARAVCAPGVPPSRLHTVAVRRRRLS